MPLFADKNIDVGNALGLVVIAAVKRNNVVVFGVAAAAWNLLVMLKRLYPAGRDFRGAFRNRNPLEC